MKLKKGERNPVVCGRKICSGCGRWRLLVDFGCHSREPLRVSGRCYACARAYRREWQAANRERARRYRKEFDDRNREKIREERRRAYRERMADPEGRERLRQISSEGYWRRRKDKKRWAADLEAKRINYRLRAAREGRKVREVKPEAYANGNGKAQPKHRRVAAAPLAILISEWLGEWGGKPLENGGYRDGRALNAAGYSQLSDLCGVSDRRLRSIVNGEQELVQFATADAICAALDFPLASLYP